jgi:CubicO group peptidase (beta-lactamase class C family)
MLVTISRLHRLAILPCALWSWAEPACLWAQTPAQFAEARAFIRQVMAERDLPSVAVAVVKDGKIVWEEGFGWADRERRLPATERTPYSLASVSKPITATGLMVLAERGAVDLDRPANDYLRRAKLSGLAGGASGATVRRVLSHTAGLPLHYEFFYRDAPYGERKMEDAIARYGILVYPPGTAYLYSNLGYGVIDQIIEFVSGQSYAEFMRSEVFEALGMRRSSVHLPAEWEGVAAQRYDARRQPIPYYDFDHDGGSAVHASAHDLARFALFHLKTPLADQRRILKDSTIDAMRQIQTPPGSGNYALGWFVGEDRGFLRVWHTGGMPGVSTVLSLYPAEKLGVVVLLNVSDGEGRSRIYERVVEAALPGYRVARREPAPAGGEFGDRSGEIPGELRGEWIGVLRTYEGEVPFRLAVRGKDDIHVALGDQLETLLNEVRYEKQEGVLAGRFAGTIPTSDAMRRPHQVLLRLWYRDGKLAGQATAQTRTDPVYFALSSYVELERSR